MGQMVDSPSTKLAELSLASMITLPDNSAGRVSSLNPKKGGHFPSGTTRLCLEGTVKEQSLLWLLISSPQQGSWHPDTSPPPRHLDQWFG